MSDQSGEILSRLLEQKEQLPLEESLTIVRDVFNALETGSRNSESGLWGADARMILSPDHIVVTYEGSSIRAMLSENRPLKVPISQKNDLRLLGYLAPEHFWQVYPPAGDVFSAAIILYETLTGVLPWEYDFDGKSDNYEAIVTTIFETRKKPPPRPSSYNNVCDEYLDGVILKALSTDIEQRYKTPAEFLSALTSGRMTQTARDNEKDPSSIRLKKKKKGSENRKKGKGFEDVAGMKDVKDILYHDVMMPLKDKSLYDKYKVTVPNGLLLYGPPGCGKTFVSQKFAEEISYHFTAVKPSDLASIYVHGTQEKIARLFKTAREKAPSILFIDEVDAILPSRQGELYHSYASEVNEFLAQMTECHEHGIFIIAATNRPEKIDPAILRTGRMDKVVYVGPPDFEARTEMFRLYLNDRPLDSDIDLKRLAELSENYVSSDIKFMVNEASRNALKERTRISQRHLEETIRNTRPSVSQRQIRAYHAFEKQRVFV